MENKRIEEIRNEINDWSIEDIKELSSQLDSFIDALEEDEEKNL